VYLLGIDSGTSVVKSVVFDLSGNEVAIARRDMPLVSPIPSSSEVDMNAVWELTAQTIAEVVREVGNESIMGVGISGTACGFWAVDAASNPVRNAILWNDGRAVDITAAWQTSGFLERVFDVSGNTMFPGYPLVLLRWLTDHEPETIAKTRWLLFHKDWLRLRLTGEIYNDIADASYFPGDIRKRTHCNDFFHEAKLNHLLDKLPPVLNSSDLAGKVTPEAAQQTGLRVGTPVVAGAVDVVASVLGGGAHRPGQACSILGTSFLNTIVSATPTFEPPGTGVQAGMPDGVFGRSLVNTSGTMCIEWMVKNLAGEEQRRTSEEHKNVYDLIEQTVSEVLVGSRGLVFLPYLNTTGIISPFTDANARAMFFGLSVEHTRADMMHAVYEGTALAMRDCFEQVPQPVEEVILVGGGARSKFWVQMLADASGKRILIPSGSEFGARGAAILAGVGAGVFDSVGSAIETMVQVVGSHLPNPEMSAKYDVLYKLYRHLYMNARESWQLRRDVLNQLGE